MAQSRRNVQQFSQASEKEKGEGAVAEVDPENDGSPIAAPTREPDASAELAESIRSLWSGLLFFSMRYNIIRIYIHFIFTCCPTITIFNVQCSMQKKKIYLSDPSHSLPSALNILCTFGKLSGYNMYLSKSKLFSVNEAASTLSFNTFTFKVTLKWLNIPLV